MLPWPSALLFGGEALGEQADYAREQLLGKAPKDDPWAPHVLLEHWPQSLVIVVARFFAPNTQSRDAAAWTRWLAGTEAFTDSASARMSGRLDLARAWRLGHELAGRRGFTLVNLEHLPESPRERAATDLFRASLRETDNRTFRAVKWRTLLDLLPSGPEWFDEWVHKRRLR
jgi:hypothetical protein